MVSSRQAPTLGMAGTAPPPGCPLTQRTGQKAVNQDIRETADRGGEVRVERHVEGIMAELGWVPQSSRAEVHGHLGGGGRNGGEPQSWAGPGWGPAYSASLGDSPGGALGAWAHLPGCGQLKKAGEACRDQGLFHARQGGGGGGGVVVVILGVAMGLTGVMGALTHLLMRPSVGLTQTPLLGIGSGVTAVGGGGGRTCASCCCCC